MLNIFSFSCFISCGSLLSPSIFCWPRPSNPDNSLLCGWQYSVPALRLLGLQMKLETQNLQAQPNPFVIVANHQANWDLWVVGCAVPLRTVSLGKKT